jgi:cell division protein FtsQ
LLSGILVIILGFVAYNAIYSPIFQVAELQVEGLRRLTAQDLNAVSDILMKSILYVNPQEIQEELLAAFPDLESVKVEVDVPANVTIRAVERRPVLTWEKGEDILWVDATGVAFPPRGDNGPQVRVVAPTLPTLTQEGEESPSRVGLE